MTIKQLMIKKIMKKELIIIGIFIFLIIVGLSGCNSTKSPSEKTPEELIIGNWHTEIEDFGITFIFYENHSVCGIVQGISVWSEYEIIDNEIVFKNSDGTSTSNEYTFSNNNQTLTLNDPNFEKMVFTKQKNN